MSDLLTAADMLEINAAFTDLKDTFHKNKCMYDVVSESYTLMDNESNSVSSTIELDCRITKMDDSGSEDVKTIEGSKNENDIEIRFFAAYLKQLNLMTGNVPVFEEEKTTFKVGSDTYQLRLISFDDSDLGGNVVLVVCHCTKMISAV